jgi:nucleotide-binding universal stress UspA family protein
MSGDSIVVAYDGSPAAERALRDGGRLLSGRRAIVLVVWKEGLGFETIALPAATVGLPPAPIDVRTALEIDQKLYEGAQSLAQQGADIADEVGLEAEGLVVADEVDVPVSETIVEVAREREAAAIVIGAHGHGRLPLLGGTTRDVLRHAPCPVVVVRDPGRR